jgi:hypothetical protein
MLQAQPEPVLGLYLLVRSVEGYNDSIAYPYYCQAKNNMYYTDRIVESNLAAAKKQLKRGTVCAGHQLAVLKRRVDVHRLSIRRLYIVSEVKVVGV